MPKELDIVTLAQIASLDFLRVVLWPNFPEKAHAAPRCPTQVRRQREDHGMAKREIGQSWRDP
jgi:hypothetical protein